MTVGRVPLYNGGSRGVPGLLPMAHVREQSQE